MERRALSQFTRFIYNYLQKNGLQHNLARYSSTSARYLSMLTRFNAAKDDGPILDFPDMGPGIPEQKVRSNESTDSKRARLFYQSRKRGISENGLLLSTFASKYLHNFDEKMLEQYDTLVNQPTNDWELYYWMTEKQPTPPEYDNEIMNMLKEHTRNEKMETRYRMPDLDEETTPTSIKN